MSVDEGCQTGGQEALQKLALPTVFVHRPCMGESGTTRLTLPNQIRSGWGRFRGCRLAVGKKQRDTQVCRCIGCSHRPGQLPAVRLCVESGVTRSGHNFTSRPVGDLLAYELRHGVDTQESLRRLLLVS